MSDLSRNSISQIFSSSFSSLRGLPRFSYKLILSLYLVANLWIISASLLGLFGRCKSDLERLRPMKRLSARKCRDRDQSLLNMNNISSFLNISDLLIICPLLFLFSSPFSQLIVLFIPRMSFLNFFSCLSPIFFFFSSP